MFALAPHRRTAPGIRFLAVSLIGITESGAGGCATLRLTQPHFSLDLVGYKYQDVPSISSDLLARPLLEVEIG